MKKRHQQAFWLLEVVLAMFIAMITFVGVYRLYEQGRIRQLTQQAGEQVIAVANDYAQLYSASLTGSVNDEASLLSLLQQSNNLSLHYFHRDKENHLKMVNGFGDLNFSEVSSHRFTVSVPVDKKQTNAFCAQIINQAYVTDCHDSQLPVPVTIEVGGG